MISRHLTVPHRFVCFTEDPRGLDRTVNVIPLPTTPDFQGWWWKTYMFKAGHFDPADINLYFDLDMVIVRNIDRFLDYQPGRFLGLRNLSRVQRPTLKKLGSAVLRWTGDHSDVWTLLVESPAQIKKFRGDQDWIWHIKQKHIVFYPDDWIRSYKWEIRDKRDLLKTAQGYRFNAPADPRIPDDTAVLAFHGEPSLEHTMDPVIVENWK